MQKNSEIQNKNNVDENIEGNSSLYRNTPTPEDMKKFLLGLDYRHVNLVDYKQQEYYSNIVASLLSVKKERDDFYNSLTQIQNFYLVQLVIDVISDDSLTEDTLTGTMINVEVVDCENSKKYTEDLKQLFSDFSIPSMMEDIMEEFLLYGEYSLEMKVQKGVGITDILDTVLPGEIIALYESGFPKIFYKLDVDRYEAYPVSSFAHFCMDAKKIKVKLPRKFKNDSELSKVLLSPMFRVGRSIFYSCLDKIKEIYMLEKALSASSFYNLTSGNIISISVPTSMQVNDMLEITQKYESLLNSSSMTTFDINDINQVTRAIQESFKVKVIPSFSEKGGLEKIDVMNQNQSKQDLTNSLRDSRELVIQTLGIPVETIFGDGGSSRRSALKQYVRYAKKIKVIQRAIQRGLKQICMNHIAYKYDDANIKADSILINMYSDTNIDEIDNLEGIQLITQSLKDFLELLSSVKDSTALDFAEKDFIDSEKFLDYFKTTLKSVGLRTTDMILSKSIKRKNSSDSGDNLGDDSSDDSGDDFPGDTETTNGD